MRKGKPIDDSSFMRKVKRFLIRVLVVKSLLKLKTSFNIML